MADDPRLPIKVVRTPSGAMLTLGDGKQIHIYGREPEVARTAGTMTRAEAEALAKDVAWALTETWGQSE
jgi:hypothetical protein